MRSLVALLVLPSIAATATVPAAAAAQSPAQQAGAPAALDPKEWSVPWGAKTRPRDPYADRQGHVWFVGQEGNYIASLRPETGEFKKYEIEPGTNPHNLVVDSRGTVWFTGNRNGRIVKMDPATGKLTNFMMPDSAVRDPHTMTFDRNGNAWFTAQGAGVVGKLTTGDGKIRLWRLSKNARPYGIVLDSRQRPWFDEFGTNKIGTIDPTTGELKEFVLPSDRARPRRIAVTSDDVIWYGDYTRGYLGRLDPATGRVEEVPMPSGAGSLPYAMASDDADRVWLAETGVKPNRLVAFDTHKRTWGESVPIGADAPNTIRHMTFDRATRLLWFGTDQGQIGRIKVPPPAIVP